MTHRHTVLARSIWENQRTPVDLNTHHSVYSATTILVIIPVYLNSEDHHSTEDL